MVLSQRLRLRYLWYEVHAFPPPTQTGSLHLKTHHSLPLALFTTGTCPSILLSLQVTPTRTHQNFHTTTSEASTNLHLCLLLHLPLPHWASTVSTDFTQRFVLSCAAATAAPTTPNRDSGVTSTRTKYRERTRASQREPPTTANITASDSETSSSANSCARTYCVHQNSSSASESP